MLKHYRHFHKTEMQDCILKMTIPSAKTSLPLISKMNMNKIICTTQINN